INSRWRFPFELSVEPTWRRNKNVSSDDRNFSRVRTFGLVGLWDRSSNWESTAFAVTGFYDTQNDSFNNLEFGGSISETFGRRLTLSGNLAWGGEWPNGGDFNNAAFGSIGVSYNVGAGVRAGGFYEPDNNYTHEDDFGGFISYQFLSFAELLVNAGKNHFVNVPLMFSFALGAPQAAVRCARVSRLGSGAAVPGGRELPGPQRQGPRSGAVREEQRRNPAAGRRRGADAAPGGPYTRGRAGADPGAVIQAGESHR